MHVEDLYIPVHSYGIYYSAEAPTLHAPLFDGIWRNAALMFVRKGIFLLAKIPRKQKAKRRYQKLTTARKASAHRYGTPAKCLVTCQNIPLGFIMLLLLPRFTFIKTSYRNLFTCGGKGSNLFRRNRESSVRTLISVHRTMFFSLPAPEYKHYSPLIQICQNGTITSRLVSSSCICDS